MPRPQHVYERQEALQQSSKLLQNLEHGQEGVRHLQGKNLLLEKGYTAVRGEQARNARGGRETKARRSGGVYFSSAKLTAYYIV
jgi:hypothetical protein